MGNWDKTTPLGSSFASLVDDNIRELKAALEDALQCDAAEGTESVFPGSAPTTAPVFRYRGLKGTTGARPAFGQYGLYFDTTRNVLQRDSGSAWEDVGTMIPAGTVSVFYQAAAPVGWTKSTANNDKALRVVSGNGGGSGGTNPVSTGFSHAHTFDHYHNLSLANYPGSPAGAVDGGTMVVSTAPGNSIWTSGGVTINAFPIQSKTVSPAVTNDTSTVDLAIQYIDVIVCTKD